VRFTAFFLTLGFLFSGCVATTEEICKQKLPDLQHSVENALEVLKDWHEDRAGRDLASLQEPAESPSPQPSPSLSESDRVSWQNWAKAYLIETQQYLDQIPSDPRFRGARGTLTEMANAFVAFHGYTEESKTGKMIYSLEQIHADGERITHEVCEKISP
jgi:hypothetical protein